MAAKLHEESSWLGKTSREVRGQKADLVVLGAQTESKKLDASVSITKDMNAAILEAERGNEVIVKEHKEWCSSFAWWAVIAVLVFDGVLIVLSRWMANHEHRKIKENKVKRDIKEGSKEIPKVVVNEATKEVDKDKDFNLKDGEVKKGLGGKANTVTVKMKDGSLKKYTFGGFNNYRKGSSDTRKTELDHYVGEIQKWEDEQFELARQKRLQDEQT